LVHIHDAATGAHLATLPVPVPWGSTCAFSPDGRVLAVGGCDNAVRLFNAETYDSLGELRHHAWPRALAFEPQSRRLARSSRLATDIGLWDITTGMPDQGFLSPAGEALSLAFSARGNWLAAACSDGAIRLWDVNSRRLCGDARTRCAASVAFVGADSVFASGGAGGVALWVAGRDGVKLQQEDSASGEVSCVAGTAMGDHIVAGSSSGTVVRLAVGDGAGTDVA